MRPVFGHRDRILVIGAGAAGRSAAAHLRRLGFTGRLTLLGDEAPYDRTACSKGILTGRRTPRDVLLPAAGPDVSVRLGVRAVDLDPLRRMVGTDNGTGYAYDGLVIATGARPVAPDWWVPGHPGLHMLHTLADAWAIRGRLRTAERIAVVGGGLTGCEASVAAARAGARVVVVDPNPTLLYRALGLPLGALVTAHHGRHLDLRLGRRVVAAEHLRRHGWRLVLDDGGAVAADVVIGCAGERADTGWLAGGGLDIGDGVHCDENLRAVGGEDIVAAGAAVRRSDPARGGHWIGAVEEGRAAAGVLLTGVEAEPPRTVPRWWSHQDDLRIEAYGRIDPAAEVTLAPTHPYHDDIARSGVLATYRLDGRLVGVAAINAPYAFVTAARALLPTARPTSYPRQRRPRHDRTAAYPAGSPR